MASYAIGIVAHVARRVEANKLMADVGGVFMSLDNGVLGCNGNHRRVWRHLVDHQSAEWFVVLEDDAVPVHGFAEQLSAALESAPCGVVSLYLGRQRPPQLQWMIAPAIKRANDENACYIVSRQSMHAVGLAVRAELVNDMLDSCHELLPFDEGVGMWVHKRRYRIAYTFPSLVDHADGETLLQHPDGSPRTPGRVAWHTGTRERWKNQYVEMN